MKYLNYLVTSKYTKNTEGHLKSEDLKAAILNHNGVEAYYNVFDVDEKSLTLDKGKPSFKGITGVVKPAFNLVQFDFDSENPKDSYDDMIKFVKWLEPAKCFVAFSGSKGFHVGVPFGYFGVEASDKLPKQLKAIATELKKTFPTMDTTVYNANRKFRLLNSKHPKTGLYKTLINPLWDYNTIIEQSKKCRKKIYAMNGDVYEPVPALTTIIASIHVEKSETVKGTREDPTGIEAFTGKKCVEKLLTTPCTKGELNITGLVIINDLFKMGKPKNEAFELFSTWTTLNNLPSNDRLFKTFYDVYDRGKYYDYGCQELVKKRYCNADCGLWRYIDPNKRPKPNNMTEVHQQQLEKDIVKKNTPKEMDIVRDLLTTLFACEYNNNDGTFSGGNIIKQDYDLFYYKDGYFRQCETREIDLIKTRIALIYGPKVKSNQIDSVFRSFMIFTPSKPEGVDLFSPNPNCANFRNGTLHLIQNKDWTYSLKFCEHKKEDYLTYKINLDYKENDTNSNVEFEEVLFRIFETDPDKLEKINCIQEMFGAALIPAFPHLFFLYGVPESGKSVICQILIDLIGEDNLSSVQPHEFNGFNMTSMINKLVNVVSDINTKATIEDSIVKQIEDRTKITIQRKNKDDLKVMLPAVHIFGANNLPKTFDGSNKAHNRRWTVIKFNNPYRGKKYRDYHRLVFSKDPQGILNFALEGLKRLVEGGGFFSDSKSGVIEKNEWQLENDPVGLFIKDIEEGEVQHVDYMMETSLGKQSGGRIKRSILWRCFQNWLVDSGRRYSRVNKQTFFRLMVDKGFNLLKNKEWYFCGIE